MLHGRKALCASSEAPSLGRGLCRALLPTPLTLPRPARPLPGPQDHLLACRADFDVLGADGGFGRSWRWPLLSPLPSPRQGLLHAPFSGPPCWSTRRATSLGGLGRHRAVRPSGSLRPRVPGGRGPRRPCFGLCLLHLLVLPARTVGSREFLRQARGKRRRAGAWPGCPTHRLRSPSAQGRGGLRPPRAKPCLPLSSGGALGALQLRRGGPLGLCRGGGGRAGEGLLRPVAPRRLLRAVRALQGPRFCRPASRSLQRGFCAQRPLPFRTRTWEGGEGGVGRVTSRPPLQQNTQAPAPACHPPNLPGLDVGGGGLAAPEQRDACQEEEGALWGRPPHGPSRPAPPHLGPEAQF